MIGNKQATELRRLIERALKARQKWQAATPGTQTKIRADDADIAAQDALSRFIDSLTA